MIKFALIGYGYRAKFYERVAKTLNTEFELTVICVTKDEVEKVKNETQIDTISSVNDLKNYEFDFVVNCASKNIISKLSLELVSMGYKVLQETPCALTVQELEKITKMNLSDKLFIAEQYYLFPKYQQIINIVQSNKLGEVNELFIEAMHDYHAYSIIREILNVNETEFKLYGKQYRDLITRTKTRYEDYKDGVLVGHNSKHVVFDFGDKRAIYNFTSEQYRSPIRMPYINVRGTRGEIINNEVRYLNDSNELVIEKLLDHNHILTEDEYAISQMLDMLGNKIKGQGDFYSLDNAIEDAYVSILMNELPFDNFKEISVKKRG